MKIIKLLLVTLILNSCALKTGYLKFDRTKQDEIIATVNIKKFMASHPNPSIVLRVPDGGGSILGNDNNSLIYNAIEKELIIAGFNVKDRGLFKAVMDKSKSSDYSQINEVTKTDLILELILPDTKQQYRTNRFYTEDDEEIIFNDREFNRDGLEIDFKLILVKENEYGGSYSFYYAPCEKKNELCGCKVVYKNYTPPRTYPQVNPCRDKNNNTAY